MKNKMSRSLTLVGSCLASAILAGGAVYFTLPYWSGGLALGGAGPVDEQVEGRHGEDEHGEDDHEGETEERVVSLPKPMWEAAKLKVESVKRRSVTGQTWATGKVMLNEERTAHIYSITEGRAHKVLVSLGDEVKEGQILAIIDSREVGTAKLELYQARLQEDFARQANDFAQRVKTNALQLIEALDKESSPDQIEETLGDKPIGKYREQLLGAYTALLKARTDYDRLKPAASSGAIAGETLINAEAALNAAKASFGAVVEQLKFAVPQDALEAQQSLQQAQQSVEVAKAKLEILGYSEEDLKNIKTDPEDGHLSHYEVVAPFAGTIIAKNVVLAERVGTDTEMFQVADLSSVWIQADIYQKDLPAISRLGDQLAFRAPRISDDSIHAHTADIFYRGDVLDPDTRTLRLRAVAENDDRHLKPGMFVEIEIPQEESKQIVAVPAEAVQEIDGQPMVFLQEAETKFRAVPVVLGQQMGDIIAIRNGVKPGDQVATSGAFSLKSEMMKGEIGHGH
ncbi:MAG: efflux RND transporter periplasmic adaptor subunit [Planctomycetaceae bacterium]|nr:efflux RND transporter periplasmic adaptor subunit [Planctomycetaceae bacterium]